MKKPENPYLIKAPAVINMLSDTNRWNIVQSLIKSDMTSTELSEKLKIKTNAISYHLDKLQESGIIKKRQSEADGREYFYSVDIKALNQMYKSAGFAMMPEKD